MMKVLLPDRTYATDAVRRQYVTRSLDAFATIAGVEKAAVVNDIPTGGANWTRRVEIEGHPPADPKVPITVDWREISPDYFSTMTANVPTIEKGKARLGMIVAERLRRNRKMTRTTSTTVNTSVNLTSCTDSRIDTERSLRMPSDSAAGSCAWSCGSSALIESTTSTVLVPG